MNSRPAINVLKFFIDVPAKLGERKPKKIKAEDLLPKTSAFFFSLSGSPTFSKEKQIMFWRSMRILTLYIKKPRPKARFSSGRYDMKKTSITPHLYPQFIKICS